MSDRDVKAARLAAAIGEALRDVDPQHPALPMLRHTVAEGRRDVDPATALRGDVPADVASAEALVGCTAAAERIGCPDTLARIIDASDAGDGIETVGGPARAAIANPATRTRDRRRALTAAIVKGAHNDATKVRVKELARIAPEKAIAAAPTGVEDTAGVDDPTHVATQALELATVIAKDAADDDAALAAFADRLDAYEQIGGPSRAAKAWVGTCADDRRDPAAALRRCAAAANDDGGQWRQIGWVAAALAPDGGHDAATYERAAAAGSRLHAAVAELAAANTHARVPAGLVAAAERHGSMAVRALTRISPPEAWRDEAARDAIAACYRDHVDGDRRAAVGAMLRRARKEWQHRRRVADVVDAVAEDAGDSLVAQRIGQIHVDDLAEAVDVLPAAYRTPTVARAAVVACRDEHVPLETRHTVARFAVDAADAAPRLRYDAVQTNARVDVDVAEIPVWWLDDETAVRALRRQPNPSFRAELAAGLLFGADLGTTAAAEALTVAAAQRRVPLGALGDDARTVIDAETIAATADVAPGERHAVEDAVAAAAPYAPGDAAAGLRPAAPRIAPRIRLDDSDRNLSAVAATLIAWWLADTGTDAAELENLLTLFRRGDDGVATTWGELRDVAAALCAHPREGVAAAAA